MLLLMESPWPGRPPDGKQLRGVTQLCYRVGVLRGLAGDEVVLIVVVLV